MKSLLKFVFLIGTILPFVSAKQIQFFRKDYIYNESFDSFYKLHWNRQVLSWDEAFLACDEEGATLYYPKNKKELFMIKSFAAEEAKRHNSNITDIFLGLHDKYGLGEFITVDGHSTESSLSVTEPDTSHRFFSSYCVLMNISSGSYRVGSCARKDLQDGLNFICKRENSVICPTIDQDYKLAKSLRKCYKINKRHMTWDEAMRTCYMEGGILTVIQNESEARWLHYFLIRNELETQDKQDKYHVGTHRITPGGAIFTIKGQKLDTVYQRLYNDRDENTGDCGAIRTLNSELYTFTTDCTNTFPFICEIELNNM